MGCDRYIFQIVLYSSYFNPRTHRGVRPLTANQIYSIVNISIHAPIVGCDVKTGSNVFTIGYFNPRTHRGVRHKAKVNQLLFTTISIHAPIVGCDHNIVYHLLMAFYFNPRTHRGVRRNVFNLFRLIPDFNPRTHRGVRPKSLKNGFGHNMISIHAPIVGCDVVQFIAFLKILKFQSTHPSWGATN